MKNEWIKTIENFFSEVCRNSIHSQTKKSNARKFRLTGRFVILPLSNLRGDRRLEPIANGQKLLYLLTKRSASTDFSNE
ncbi:MAG: hypothetical protein ACRC2R_07395 [Xenococcaceae cyanobacterium]